MSKRKDTHYQRSVTFKAKHKLVCSHIYMGTSIRNLTIPIPFSLSLHLSLFLAFSNPGHRRLFGRFSILVQTHSKQGANCTAMVFRGCPLRRHFSRALLLWPFVCLFSSSALRCEEEVGCEARSPRWLVGRKAHEPGISLGF